MRSCGLVPLLVVAVLSACAAVSPRPELADASTLPVRELSVEETAELAAHVNAATAAVVRARYDDAEGAANEALTIDPRAARARAVIAMVKLQRARREDPPPLFDVNTAETEMHVAGQLAPDDAFVGWMHAAFLAEAGHMSAAAAAAEAALGRAGAATPDERAALLGLAGTYRYELGEERAAIPHLRAFVALRANDASAHYLLGGSLLRVAALSPAADQPVEQARRDAEDAVQAFDRCVELVPGDVDSALAGAAATWRAAELAEKAGAAGARDELRNATTARLQAIAERFPDHPEAMFRLGVVAEATGAPVAAKAAYGRALERDAAHVPSLLNLAAMHDASGDAGDAIALLQRVLAADTAQPTLTSSERRRVLARIARG